MSGDDQHAGTNAGMAGQEARSTVSYKFFAA
jgi:hypothetical protein